MRMAFRTPVAQYAIALLCVAVALELGLAFQAGLGDGFAFAMMIVAVMLAGSQGGFGPALLASLLGAAALMRFVLNPTNGFAVSGVESQAGLVLYLFVTAGIAIVTGLMRRAQRRAQARAAEVVRALEDKLKAEQNLNLATRQLERSEAFHRLITELTSDFTFRVVFDGQSARLESVSSGFESIVGYSLQELEGRGGWRSLVHSDDLPLVERTLERTRQGESDRAEIRMIGRAGDVFWFRYLSQPSRNERGEIDGLVGAAQHITKQKQLEAVREQLMTALAEKNSFIESVLGQVRVGILVADTASGKLIACNREAERATGIATTPGESVSELVQRQSTRALDIDGADFSLDQWPIARALRGEEVQDEKLAFENENGPARMLSVSGGPITDRDGHPIAAVAVLHDESERRRSEQQVLESQRFLRCSLDALSSHIAVLDDVGQILEVNEAWRRFADENGLKYFRYGIGTNYLEPFETRAAECGDGPSVARGIRDVMAGVRDAFEYEYPCHSPSEQRWFLLRVTRFKSPGPVRVVIAHENVTKLRLAVDSLREADRRKDEFLATLAHELRNPLAPIRNAIHILKLTGTSEPAAGQTIQMLERQTAQLTRLVDDLMDVSRVMRGKIELRLETVDLASVIHQAIETAQPLLSAKHHLLVLELSEKPLYVVADPVRLSQVICNLLTNAAKYTEPNGRIVLTSSQSGESAVVGIRDNGIGIAPDQLRGIFELFMQVDHTTSRAQGGLGIGLTLVKNLVELHGGAVQAKSAGLGQGSEFIVTLPLTAAPALESSADGDQVIAASTPSGCRIMVVDDNCDAANSLAMLLRTLGHQVKVAHSGSDALAMVESFAPAIMFLDIGMPEMDGYEVARRLRADPANTGLCLAALTGWGQAEDRRKTAEAGFNHHIVKPPDMQAILRVVAEAQQPKELGL